MIQKILLCFSILLTSSLSYAAGSGNTVDINNSVNTLPVTYVGTLPCADCSGIRTQLNLLPDNIFHLRQIYMKNNEKSQFDSIGKWQITENKALKLENSGIDNIAFESIYNKQLRLLDQDDQSITSKLNYNLIRLPSFKPIEPKLSLLGMYSYMADAGRITLCETGQSMPVVMEADNAALQSAYIAARTKPGEPMLVNVYGQIAKRKIIEETPLETSMIVEKFIKIIPDQACPVPQQETPLATGIYWKLIYLDNAKVEEIEGARQAHIVFDEKEQRMSGSGGCNRIMGSYQLNGEKLTFGPTISTRMFCDIGMKTEAALTANLDHVRSWKISKGQLELFDEAGKTLAIFKANPPPQEPK